MYKQCTHKHLRPRKQIGPGAPKAPQTRLQFLPPRLATLCASTFFQKTGRHWSSEGTPKKVSTFAPPTRNPMRDHLHSRERLAFLSSEDNPQQGLFVPPSQIAELPERGTVLTPGDQPLESEGCFNSWQLQPLGLEVFQLLEKTVLRTEG